MAASNTDKDLGREDEAPGVDLVEGAVVVGSRLTTSDSDPFFLHREARRGEEKGFSSQLTSLAMMQIRRNFQGFK